MSNAPRFFPEDWGWNAIRLPDRSGAILVVAGESAYDEDKVKRTGNILALFNGAIERESVVLMAAAAPDLYDIAKEILGDSEADTGLKSSQIARLSVAVAKAEGR